MVALKLHLDDTLGCIFIGGVLSSGMLYGFASAQFILYLRHYATRDKLSVKCLVLFAWMLDTTATASDMSFGWYYLVQRHADLFGLLVLPKAYELEYAVTGFITCLVQMFYVREIWKLVREMPLMVRLATISPPMILSLFSLAFSLVGVYVTSSHDWIITKTLPPNVKWTTSRVWTAAAADICITVVLCWALSKKKTGFKQSDRMINTLITYIINRGVLSAMVQIALCATFIASIKQNKMLWVIFHTAGGKIYVNSMMAVLNARQLLNNNGPEVYNMSDLSENSTPGRPRRMDNAPENDVYYIS
ncbi:hypothetical protein FOMPIDRAFT_1049054 [Fomitopsis schrenkii]|uniref:DUF6534 domain-containing protein n=1 Tax=Fomitopsis schrenkii TaxID=2126942 RepID=S8FS63_FOMSC|nr:hypothetical protein FOMPIDRAFT_1049054 [Fomitopsis schrenkii]